ncbi:MAG: hypothetical protein M0Z54_10830, partial [Thermaerobacter sp.]|nr:hypothetical protein [Thermaerobacter sp.]
STASVVPGPAITTPWIEYQGQHVSSVNEIPLPANTPVALQVVNVDAAGDPVDVTGTAPLAVQLPTLPSGESWQASRGGVSSSSMTVDIQPGQSSANVWLVSSTTAAVSSPTLGQDLSTEAMATGATVVNFIRATSSTNGSMVLDVNYDTYGAALASGTVAAPSAFTVVDNMVSDATLTASAAVVSGPDTVALTVAIASGSADATVVPFNNFTVATAASAVDSVQSGNDFATVPVSAATSGSTYLPGLPTSYVTAAGESKSLNQPGDLASAMLSGYSTAVDYAGAVSDFAELSTGSAIVLSPFAIESGQTVSSSSTSSGDQTVALFYNPYTASTTYLDLTNEAPPSGARGSAYVGFEFANPSIRSVSIWYSNAAGVLTNDGNTTSTDYLYVALATGTTGGTSWGRTPHETIRDWIVVNGTYYSFVTDQP